MSPRILPLLAVLAFPAVARGAEPDCIADVEVAAGPILQVHYRCTSSARLTFQPDGRQMMAHLSDLVVEDNEARYRFDLAAFARDANSTSVAVLRSGGVLATLSSWLLEPRGFAETPTIDIRARTAPGLGFTTGLPRAGDAWRLAGSSVPFAGYTAIGHFHLADIEVPAPGSLRAGAAPDKGVLRLAILEGATGVTNDHLVDWARRTAEAESNYWQGFVARQSLVGFVPMPNRRSVGFGRSVSGGGATVMVEVGAEVDRRRLFDDWVLVHELIHSGMPYIRGRASWAMEGAATYVEPIIRARAGWKSEEDVWKEWIGNMPQGVPVFARGLQTATNRDNYWGGALFMLLTDIAIRRATDGAKGLEDCLGGVLWSGMDASGYVYLPAYAQACDRATGTTAMVDLVNRHTTVANPVDLDALWRDLGVAAKGGHVAFDDKAPLAKWRARIVLGNRGPKRVKLPWDS